MVLKVKDDYTITRFYEHGDDDTFDYFYYRNNNIFKKNDFHEDASEFYNGEEYTYILGKLKMAKIASEDRFMLPKGEHELFVMDNGAWEIIINGITITEMCNLLDEDRWSFDPTAKKLLTIIQ